MRRMFHSFFRDERGETLSYEMVLILAFAVLMGLILPVIRPHIERLLTGGG
ncbi:hypothetical protein [Thermoflexus sp.]|uniref:hypothetical protein n=1 Tax=Thermoflexus sp. TaxID=1969742 RepID=UPI002ADE6947|nr:hypothetical protein [Thermoflexus sp.]